MLKISTSSTGNILSIALLVFLVVACQHDPRTRAVPASTSYIVQAQSLEQAKAITTQVGADITHELGIINAVGANLNTSQVEALRRQEGVKVMVNGKVSVSDVSDEPVSRGDTLSLVFQT